METLAKAISLAMGEFKKEYGEDARLEEGDGFATVFNDCVLIISLEGGQIRTDFLCGKPYIVDMSLGLCDGDEEDG